MSEASSVTSHSDYDKKIKRKSKPNLFFKDYFNKKKEYSEPESEPISDDDACLPPLSPPHTSLVKKTVRNNETSKLVEESTTASSNAISNQRPHKDSGCSCKMTEGNSFSMPTFKLNS